MNGDVAVDDTVNDCFARQIVRSRFHGAVASLLPPSLHLSIDLSIPDRILTELPRRLDATAESMAGESVLFGT
jgi:hypothetical protein